MSNDDDIDARVRAALGETGASLGPRPGWEQRVWARIDAEEAAARGAGPGPRASWRGWLIGGGLVAAAAIALIVWQPWRGTPDVPLGTSVGAGTVAMAPSISSRKGEQVMRSRNFAVGQTLVLRHPVPTAVMWVYFEDALIHEGGAAIDLVLERPGSYYVISALGPARAPAMLDTALAELVTSGAPHHRDLVEVR